MQFPGLLATAVYTKIRRQNYWVNTSMYLEKWLYIPLMSWPVKVPRKMGNSFGVWTKIQMCFSHWSNSRPCGQVDENAEMRGRTQNVQT